MSGFGISGENAFVIASALGVKLAVPLSSLSEVIRAPAPGARSMLYRGRSLELTDLCGEGGESGHRVLVPKAEGAQGLRVSCVLGVREIPGSEVKTLGGTPMRGAVPPGVTGVAVTGGEVVFVVDPAALSAGVRGSGAARE